MKWYHHVLKHFIAIAITLNIFLLVFQYFAFNETYYLNQFQNLEVAETIGINEEDLQKVTHALVQSIKSGPESLMVVAKVDGLPRLFFNAKERQHMVDVYHLFQGGQRFVFIIQLLMVVSILLMYQVNSKNIDCFIKPLKYALFYASGFLVFLASLYFIDFNWAFTRFHELFFSNDLWLLDPRKDRLIMLMPLPFFIDFVKRWLLVSLIGHLVLAGVYLTLRFKLLTIDSES